MSRFTILMLLACSAATLFARPARVVAVCLPDHPLLSDTIPPDITCPPSITLTLGGTTCDTVFHYTVTASDNEPGVIVAKVFGISSGGVFPAGMTTNLFLAVDAAGNTASCSFTVQVNTVPPPSLLCRDSVTLYVGNGCSAQAYPGDLLHLPFGCLDAYAVEVDKTLPFGNGPWVPATFGSADLNKIYQYRVRNLVSGNSCWALIKLADNQPPALECPTIQVPCAVPSNHLLPGFLTDSLGFSTAMPAVSDNCPGASTSVYSDVSENLPCGAPNGVTGTISRTWLVSDASGNTATCLQIINRVRSLDNIHFPNDTAVFCSAPDAPPTRTGAPAAAVGGRQYDLLTAPFCEIDAFYDDSLETTCGGGWRIRRVWEVRDLCLPTGPDNPVYGTQYINVRDTVAPQVQCPANTVLLTGADADCRVTVNLPDVFVRDDCSPVTDAAAFWMVGGLTKTLGGTLSDFAGNNLADSDTLAVFGPVSDFPAGDTEVLYVFSDACGNSISCSFRVLVWDSVPPNVVCKGMLNVYLDASGQAVLPAELANNGSSDACGDLHFKIRRDSAGACAAGEQTFSDALFFCCAEAGDTITAILRVYDVAPPDGVVPDTFATGQFADCGVSVLVQDTLGPACAAPPDVQMDCYAFEPNLAVYGLFSSSCQADSSIQVTDYSQFDTVCRAGIIVRYFQVFDTGSGQNVTCSQRITVDAAAQHYYIRFPDDKIITQCDAANNYGSPVLFGTGCENLMATYTDEIFTIVPDACYRIDRTWVVRNTCTYDANLALTAVPNPTPNPSANHPTNLPGPVVSAPSAPPLWASTTVAISPGQTPTNFSTFWSANANGYSYKQSIKVIDVQKPMVDTCPPAPVLLTDATNNDPLFWHALYWYDQVGGLQDMCEGPAELCFTSADLCSGADVDIRYLLFLDLDNDGIQESVVNSTHLFNANTVFFNNAGNANYGGGLPRRFDERPVPINQQYGFSIQTTTDGNKKTACVRWRTQSQPLNFVTPQLPYGTHRIRWFATDKCGNETTCEYIFTIQNSSGVCGGVPVLVGGNIRTEAGAGLPDVTVTLDRAAPNQPPTSATQTTDTAGDYLFNVSSGGSYAIKPERDVDHLNGVSTLDLLLINKHILGLDTLDSAYRMIAADANNSRSITTFDIVEIRKLILGVYTELPNNTSWRFVDADYVFPQPANPFSAPFPETISGLNPAPANPPVHDFIGVKVGDANGSAAPNVTGPDVLLRTDAASFFLDLPDQALRAGVVVDVPVRLSASVAGFQFALHLPGLDVLDVLPGPGLTAENFAVFPADGLLTASWTGDAPAVFTLRLRARTAGRLSEYLRLLHHPTRPEAYLADGADFRVADLALRFDGGAAHPAGLELFQNRPNPFAVSTEIGFYLPQAKTATLRVFDTTGRERYAQTAWYAAGMHTVVLTKDMLGGAGSVLYYTLETDVERAVRMLVIR
ncbi:MAG: HYR domain-containing protein [Lewinellaceae bacterium]|nr:HYR domain-containing protein [Lewinellaceae bacterium]